MTESTMPSPECCILFATADWNVPYWTNKQHTAKLLASQGCRVLYVESPGLRTPSATSGRDWARLMRRLFKGLRSLLIGPVEVANNLWVLSPLMIPVRHSAPLVRRINQGLLRHSLKRFIQRQNSYQPLIWTYHPFILEAIKGITPKSIVYHCVDDLAAVPGIDAEAFNTEEIRLLKSCQAVFTTSMALHAKCATHNPNTFYYSNVVDANHFNRAMEPGPIPKELAHIAQPRLVYHGVLSDFKVDFALLLAIAHSHPEWQLVLIGDEREGQTNDLLTKLRELPNVHFLGHRSYHSLPEYLRGMDVGLLPTLLNEYTRSMFPMKFYEYLAAGLPVVSTPLEFTTQSHPFLDMGTDAETFAAAIQGQLLRGKLHKDEAHEAVGDATWEHRMEKMLNIAMTTNGKQTII